MADRQPIEPDAIEPGAAETVAADRQPVEPGAAEGRTATVNRVRQERGSLLARLGWVRLLLILAALGLAAASYYAINHDGDFPGADPIRTAADATTRWSAVLVYHRDTRDERAEFPNPVYRHFLLKELMVELTNAHRAEAGAPPVRMGSNPAAQLHAEASLDACYASHWDRWGLKPHHRYSLAGGAGAGAENIAGLDYCVKFRDGHLPIASMEDEVAEAVAQWMRSPDHRQIMLDPAHTLLNIGIAHDRFNATLVQHFGSDYVHYDQRPGIDPQGILRFRGTVSGASLEIGETISVQIAYDPPPRYLTTGQLAHTYALCSPVVVAHLVGPLQGGAHYASPPVREELTWQRCVDPYQTPADHPRPGSPSEANKALTVAVAAGDAPEPVRTGSLRIIADRMEIADDRFDAQADLSVFPTRAGYVKLGSPTQLHGVRAWPAHAPTATTCAAPTAAPTGLPRTATPGASRLTVAGTAITVSPRRATAVTTPRASKTRPWTCTAKVPAWRPSAALWESCRRPSIPGSKKARQSRELMLREARRRRKRRLKPAKVIAFDEMWTYVKARRKGKRREVWVWTAVVMEADGSRWVDFQVGDRSEKTFLKLYRRLPEAERYRSDHYQVYEWLPQDRRVAGKGGEVNWNEGLHSRFRDSLKRLQRKTKGYTKRVAMLRDSIALVCLRLGLF